MKCKKCGKEIRLMSMQGTGFCSENCVSGGDPTANPSAGVRRHRGTRSTPARRGGGATFKGA